MKSRARYLWYCILAVVVPCGAPDGTVAADAPAARDGDTPVVLSVDAAKQLAPFTDLDRAMDSHWLSWVGDPGYIAQYPHLRADGFEIARIIGPLTVPQIYTDKTPVDAHGNPVYDFVSFDAMLDPIVQHGFKPMLIMNYVPDVLAVSPSSKANGQKWWRNDSEVKDYDRWEDLVYKTLRHCQEKWGREVVATWLCETWNEGDYGDYGLYQGRASFLKLQDHTVNAIKRVDPRIRIGGPGTVTSTYKRGGGSWVDAGATTLHGIKNPTKETAPDWRDSVAHFATGTNYATGKVGTPVDFVTSHMYDLAGTVDSGKGVDVIGEWMMRTVGSYPTLAGKPVIISEWSSLAPKWPHDTVFEAVRAVRVLIRSRAEGLSGIVHHSQATPPKYDNLLFSGYPSLYTWQGPVRTALGSGRALYNRLAGVQVEADGQTATVGAIAALDADVLRVLVCYYEADPQMSKDQPVQLSVTWPAAAGKHIAVTRHRMDTHHANPRKLWETMGRPNTATPQQLTQLMAEAEIPTQSYQLNADEQGTITLHTVIPSPGVQLLELHARNDTETE